MHYMLCMQCIRSHILTKSVSSLPMYLRDAFSHRQMTARNTILEGYMNIDIIFAAIVLKVQGGWLVLVGSSSADYQLRARRLIIIMAHAAFSLQSRVPTRVWPLT